MKKGRLARRLMALFCAGALLVSGGEVSAAGGSEYLLASQESAGVKTRYLYNKSGLITEQDQMGGSYESIFYTYGKSGLISDMLIRSGREESTYHHEYIKGGRRSVTTSNLFGSTVIQYQYGKKNRLEQEIWSVNSIPIWKTAMYIYDNGRISSYSEKYMDGYADSVQVLSYDKRGNLSRVEYGNSHVAYKNTYKNGRLVKRVDENGVETTYKYKKANVSSKFDDIVEQQQWKLVNSLVPGRL